MIDRSEERFCPRCGRRMRLVAAGWYCVKDDFLIDRAAGKLPARPECMAWVVGEWMGEIFFDKDHLFIKEPSGKLFLDIPLKDVSALERGEMRRSGDRSTGAAAAALEKVPTLKITYSTKPGLKCSVTLATERAADLARTIESLRSVGPVTP